MMAGKDCSVPIFLIGPTCILQSCSGTGLPTSANAREKTFMMAVEVRTTERWLIRISFGESAHISSSFARMRRGGANDIITSDTYGSAPARWVIIYIQSRKAALPERLRDIF